MRACLRACVRACVYSCNHHEDKILFIKHSRDKSVQGDVTQAAQFMEECGEGGGGWREKKKIPSDGGMEYTNRSTCHMFSISWQYLQTVHVIVVSFFTHLLQPYLIQVRPHDKQTLMEAESSSDCDT